MVRYTFDPEKHSQPSAEYDLSRFYFIVHEGKLLIFTKGVQLV